MAQDNISKFYQAFNEKYDNFGDEQEFRDFLKNANRENIDNLYNAFNSAYDNFGSSDEMANYLGWAGTSPSYSEPEPVRTESQRRTSRFNEMARQRDAARGYNPEAKEDKKTEEWAKSVAEKRSEPAKPIPEKPVEATGKYADADYKSLEEEYARKKEEYAPIISEYEAKMNVNIASPEDYITASWLGEHNTEYNNAVNDLMAIGEEMARRPEYKSRESAILSDTDASDEAIKALREDGNALNGELAAAQLMNKKIRQLANQPYSNTGSKKDALGYLAGAVWDYGKGTIDRVKTAEWLSRGLTKFVEGVNLRPLQEKLQKMEAELKPYENTEDYEYMANSLADDRLTDEDKVLLASYLNYGRMMELRENNVPLEYRGGQMFADTAGYMLDFLLTGRADAAGRSAMTKALGKWAPATLFGKGIKAGALELGGAFTRTLSMVPQTMGQIGDSLSEMETVYDENGNVDGTQLKRSVAGAVVDGLAKQFIEVASEGSGEIMQKAVGTAISRAFKRSAIPKTIIGRQTQEFLRGAGGLIRRGQFQGMGYEDLEEILGATANVALGKLTGGKIGDEDALKQTLSKEAQQEMLIGFLPLTAVSTIGSLKAASRMQANYDESMRKWEGLVQAGAVTEEDLNNVVDGLENKSTEDVMKSVAGIYEKIRKSDATEMPETEVRDMMNKILEGKLAYDLQGDLWGDSQERMELADAYASSYGIPVEGNLYDITKSVETAATAAKEVGFTDEDLNKDASILMLEAIGMEGRGGRYAARAEALKQYAIEKARQQAISDGYKKETTDMIRAFEEPIINLADNNGSLIVAQAEDGQEVYVASKDAIVGTDGKVSAPTGPEGLVSVLYGDGSTGTVKANTLGGAQQVDTETYLMDKELQFNEERGAQYQQAMDTMSERGMAEAVGSLAGQTVFVTGNGAYEPVRIERTTNEGTNAVISGDKEALKGIATALGIQSPGGTMLEVPAAELYDLLAKEDDGTISTGTQAETTAEAPVEEAATAPVVNEEQTAEQEYNPDDYIGTAVHMNDGRDVFITEVGDGNVSYEYQDANGETKAGTMTVSAFQNFMRANVGTPTPTPAAEPAPAPAPEVVEETTVQETAQGEIPIDEETGEPIYDAEGITPEQAYNDIYGRFGEDTSDADSFVVEQSDAANKALNKAQKASEKAEKEKAEIDKWKRNPGEGLNAFAKRKADAKAEVDNKTAKATENIPELKRKSDFWKEIREVAEANIAEAKAEAERQKLIEQYGVDTSSLDLTPRTMEEALADGLAKFFNGGERLSLGSVLDLVGWNKLNDLRKGGYGFVLSRKPEAVPVDKFVLEIADEYPGYIKDEQDAINMVGDLLMRNTRGELGQFIFNARLNEARNQETQESVLVEEAPVEETVVEEAPVQEETPVEEPAAPAEEPVEDLPEDLPEETVEEEPVTETPAGEAVEQAPEESYEPLPDVQFKESEAPVPEGTTAIQRHRLFEFGQTAIREAAFNHLLTNNEFGRTWGYDEFVEAYKEEAGEKLFAKDEPFLKEYYDYFKSKLDAAVDDYLDSMSKKTPESSNPTTAEPTPAPAPAPVAGEETPAQETENNEDISENSIKELWRDKDNYPYSSEVSDLYDALYEAFSTIGNPNVSRDVAAGKRKELIESAREHEGHELADAILARVVVNNPATIKENKPENTSKTPEKSVTSQKEEKTVEGTPAPVVERELTEEEIRNSGYPDEDVIDAAIDYINGDRSISSTAAYNLVKEYVRPQRNATEQTGGNADGTQLDGPVVQPTGVGAERSGGEGGELGGSAQSGTAERIPGNPNGGVSAGEGGTARTAGVGRQSDVPDSGSNVRGGRGGSRESGRPNADVPAENGTPSQSGQPAGRTEAGSTDIAALGGELEDLLKQFADTNYSIDRDINGLDSVSYSVEPEQKEEGALSRKQPKKPTVTLSFEGLTPKQVELAGKIIFSSAKLGYAFAKTEGLTTFNDFRRWFKSKFGDAVMKGLNYDESSLDAFINEVWNTKLKIDGQRLTLEQHASELHNEELRNNSDLTPGERTRLQKEANEKKIPFKAADRKNIAEALPQLNPGQWDDLVSIERQFYDPSHNDYDHAYGKGMMITNGTGTGKTYTGLGTIKRFVDQGKGRILLVAPAGMTTEWVDKGKAMGIKMSKLDDTKDKGEGVVVTSYQNFRENKALYEDDFDLVVYDESHNILENQAGDETIAYEAHKRITNKNVDEATERLVRAHTVPGRRLTELEKEDKALATEAKKKTTKQARQIEIEMRQEEIANEISQLNPQINALKPQFRERAEKAVDKTKVLFLSATPFNTIENLKYAEGYIFQYPRVFRSDKTEITDEDGRKSAFMTEWFRGDEPMEEREIAFGDHILDDLETVSFRELENGYDHSRDFPDVSGNIMASRFNFAFQSIMRNPKYTPLKQFADSLFSNSTWTTQLYETMKASALRDRLKEHLDAGRKIVIFHDRMHESKASDKLPAVGPPFQTILDMAMFSDNAPLASIMAFKQEFADILKWEAGLDYRPVQEQVVDFYATDADRAKYAKKMEQYDKKMEEWRKECDAYEKAHPNMEPEELFANLPKPPKKPQLEAESVAIYNGEKTDKEKEAAKAAFNDDNSKVKIICVTTRSGGAGLSLHDTTGKHPRVMIQTALPVSPIGFIQAEGRIFRWGNKSNAAFEYPRLGLDVEAMKFAMDFNAKAETVENLAHGFRGRGLKDSIMTGFYENSGNVPIAGQGIGGVEMDKRGNTLKGMAKAKHDYGVAQRKGIKAGDKSIPETIGYVLSGWGNMQSGDQALIPFAGRGSIARYMPKGVSVSALEQDIALQADLFVTSGSDDFKLREGTFTELNPINKADVVILNGNTDGGLNQIETMRKGFLHLSEGGRLIAIVPNAEKEIEFTIKDLEGQGAVLRSTILVNNSAIDAGNDGVSRIVVVDKISKPAMRATAGKPTVHDLTKAEKEGVPALIEAIKMPERIIDKQAIAIKKIKSVLTELRKNKMFGAINVYNENDARARVGFEMANRLPKGTNQSKYRFDSLSNRGFYYTGKWFQIPYSDFEKVNEHNYLITAYQWLKEVVALPDDAFIRKAEVESSANKETIDAFRDMYRLYMKFIRAGFGLTEAQIQRVASGLQPDISAADIDTLNSYPELRAKFEAANHGDEERQDLYDKVAQVGEKIGLTIGAQTMDRDFLGGYNNKDNTLMVNKNRWNGLSDEKRAQTLLHEFIHSVTVYALAGYNTNAPGMSDALFDAAKLAADVYEQITKGEAVDVRPFTGQYSIENEKELLAEMANSETKEKLQNRRMWVVRTPRGIRVSGSVMDGAEQTTAWNLLNEALDGMLKNFDKDLFDRFRGRVSDFFFELDREGGYTRDADLGAADMRENGQTTEEAENESPVFSDDENVQKNIESGLSALERLAKGEEEVSDAMRREELGELGGTPEIAFIWGTPGRVTESGRYKGGEGFSKIIAKHGIDDAIKVVETIAKGQIGKPYGVPNGQRVDIDLRDHHTTVSLFRNGESKSWVLTGYTIDNNTDAKGRGSDLSNATQTDPIRTRDDLGAALKSIANIERIFGINNSGAEQEVRFRDETDADVLERLESEPKVKAYRAMQFVPDPNGEWEFDLGDGKGLQKGNLYPPMSAKVNGKWRNPVRRQAWERSVEQPELAREDGTFLLDKGNKKSVPAAYNPYFHSSATMLNDQFSEAQSRDNLVVVEVEIPEREVSAKNINPYKAEKAKDAVGVHEWKAGPIQGQLSGTRAVYLSRWDKPMRIVPVDEVAYNVEKMIRGQVDVMPTNVVWPQLREELEKLGVKFVETNNQGKLANGKYYATEYKKTRTKEEQKAAKKAKDERTAEAERIRQAEIQATNKTLDRMGEELGVKINKVSRSEMPTGHSTDKGYYDPSTGEMTICMDNVTDERDAIATVFHETVGHKGLRELFGPRFREAMKNIYAALDAKGRAWVNGYIARHGLNFGDEGIIRGMEEYLSHIAERGDFKDTVWSRIKEVLGKIVDLVFCTDGFVFTDRELNYILRASYEHLKDPNWLNTIPGKAKDTLWKRELGINETDPNRPTDPDGPGTGLLYRDGDTGFANEDYNNEMDLARNKMIIENQNADLPVKIGMDKVKKETGKTTLADDEDYLTRHNLASSRAETEAHNFELFHFKPMLEQVRAIQSALLGGKSDKDSRKKAYERVLDYIYAVSGLERNAYKNAEIEQEKQDLLQNETDPEKIAKITAKYDAMKKDWSGITSLMGRPAAEWQEAEADAQDMVDAFKSEVGDDAMLDTLWDRIRSCTDFSLEHAYKHGLLTRDEFEKLHGTASQPRMWEHYVPMRGFKEDTAEEEFGYSTFTQPSTNGVVVKKMSGRWTQADNPLANILNIAETEIVQGNDNWAKQALYRFTLNAGKNTLLTVTEPWFVKNPATGTWSLAEPYQNESLEDFEARMQALRSQSVPLAKKGRQGLRIDKIMVNKAHQNEHLIKLKVAGMDKMVWVNGNPALAKAVSGVGRSQNMRWLRRASRVLSNLFTTYSLDFSVKNLIRDTIYSRSALIVKEDKAYRHQFEKNWWSNFGYGAFAFPMIRLAAQWESGELQSKPAAQRTKREQQFIDFMTDGGQTGYTIINSVNQIKRDLERSMRRAGKDVGGPAVPILGHYANMVKTLNEGFELLTRFTAYQTSRDMGRSGQRSASDAKEISVNFNRRGAQSGNGVWGNIAAYLGATHYFYNAGVQGFDNFLRLYKTSPKKMGAITAGIVMMGILTPLINSMLAGTGGGDDDWYWNIPEWVRRNNIIIGTGRSYLAVPLPVEFRAIYGLGDIAASAFCYQKYPNRTFGRVAGDMISTASGILPVNPVEGYTGTGNLGDAALRAVAPDATMFFVDWATNRDYTGRPLWKDNPFSDTVPKSQGAYASTPKGIVNACQKLAEVSAGAIDVPPGLVRDFMNNYGGGFFRAAEDVSKIMTGVIGNDPDRPFRWDNVPFFSGFTGHIDEDRSNAFATNALREYKDISENIVKKVNAICNTKDITAAMVYGDKEIPEEYASKVRVQRILSGKDYELGKEYRDGMNNQYKMKQYVRGEKAGQWYKSKEVERVGVDGLKKKWRDLREEWASMPNKTEDEKSAKAQKLLEVQDAWHEYYNAEGDLAEKLMNIEYGKK